MISIKCILNLEVPMKKLLMKKWIASENSARNPIDCYRHFITDESISLMFRATNQHVEQCLQTHKISRRSNIRQWKSTIDEEMPMFLRIIIEIGLVSMLKLSYYLSSSQLYGSKIIQSTMSRE